MPVVRCAWLAHIWEGCTPCYSVLGEAGHVLDLFYNYIQEGALVVMNRRKG